MKNRILTLLVLFNLTVVPKLFSQSVAVNSTGNNADTSAILDVSSTTKGFLLPRMTTSQQNAIVLPATGLAIFNTTVNSFQVNTGTPLSPVWVPLMTTQSILDTNSIAGFSQKVRSLQTAGPGINYDSITGVITNEGVLSLNGNTGALTMDTSYVANFSTKVRSLFSSSTPITYSNGLIGISQATTSTNGYLSNSDWNTFNSKASGASISGTTNYITKFTAAGTVGNSTLQDNGTIITTPELVKYNANYGGSYDARTLVDKNYVDSVKTNLTTRIISTTAPLQGGGDLSANRTLSITDAAADGVTKGAAAFTANDFNTAAGLVSIDYANAQAANTTTKGFLTSADWNTFNTKLSTIDTTNIATFSTKVRSLFSSSSPITYSNGLIGISQANGSTSGYLSSADWNTFNTKGTGSVTTVSVISANGVTGSVATPTTTPAITLTLGAITPTSVAASGNVTGLNLSGTNTGNVTLGTANGLSLSGQAISMALANTSTTGALSNTDWNIFNNKANAYTSGDLTETGSGVLTISGGVASVLGTGTSIQVKQANTTQDGFLSSSDWNTFNNKASAANINGTINTIPKFTAAGTVGNSALQDNGSIISTPEVIRYAANYGGVFDARTLVDKNYVDSVKTFITSSVKDTFTSNITVTSINGLGKYATNAVIPAIGKTAAQVLIDALTQVIAPTYTAPTASISCVPGAGIVEIGSTLNVTLSSTFTQNDGGSSTGTVYYMGASPLGSNTSTVNNITAPVTYKVNISYGQGNCKLNNQGVTDCSGRISAGSVNSSTITFTPMAQRYWGRCNGVPSSATVIASAGGGSDFVNSKTKTAFSVAASGSNNIFFAYPATLGDLTAISVGGFDSFPAFTKNTVSVTNASGYTQNYIVYISNNTLSADATNINVQ